MAKDPDTADCHPLPKKHLRRDSDIEQFGNDLSRRWQPADGIEPWLRSLEPELSHKVRHERWSWEGIARALNAAGIVYEIGRPWTGISLGHKIMSIRHEARQRTSRDAAHAGPSASQPPGRACMGGNAEVKHGAAVCSIHGGRLCAGG